MNSITFFLSFIPFLALILLSLNLIFAPHNSYQEKSSTFECGFHSFLGQNRTQFNISFFVFALLFLLFDMELVLLFPGALSLVVIDIYGLILMLIFFIILTVGFAFELGKKALSIDSRQNENKLNCGVEHNIYYSIIFILEKRILQIYSIILFIFSIIKEYILKFNIITLILGVLILKYLSYRMALILYILRIVESIKDIPGAASYIILIFIAVMLINTPLKGIPKVLITLMLNSTVIGFIVILVCFCFTTETFSYSILIAYTYFISHNMGDDFLTFMNYHPTASGAPWGDPSGGGPSGGGAFPGDQSQNSSETKKSSKKWTPEQKDMQRWKLFTKNWGKQSIHKGSGDIVTRMDLLNTLSKDQGLRTRDSSILHDAFTNIYKDKWPGENTHDPVFEEIKEVLNKKPQDAFKYNNSNDKRIVENSIKRLDVWTREWAHERKYFYRIERLEPLTIEVPASAAPPAPATTPGFTPLVVGVHYMWEKR